MFGLKFFKKIPLKSRLILIPIFCALLAITYLILSNARSVEADWWNDTWIYRQSIPITNNTSEETDVYVSVTIDTSDTTQFQADCDDLRFTKLNGEMLPHYLVSGCSTASTVVHVNFDTFLAGTSTIYYYYGNSSATNNSSATDFNTEASDYTVGSIGSQEITPAPIAHWKFDEGYGTTANDSAGSNHSSLGTGSSAPTWTSSDQCISGSCLYFDGTDDYIDTGSITAGVRTVSFWLKPISNTEYPIDLNGSAYISASSGTLSATGFTSPTIYVNAKASTTLTANKWQYITITTDTAITANDFDIGKIEGVGYLNGYLDDVKIYPYARTAAQIKTDYNAGKSGASGSSGTSVSIGGYSAGDALSNGLIGYWKMDDNVSGDSQTIIDSSGNSNNGTTYYGANTTGMDCSIAGKYSHGCELDGTDDYLSIDPNPIFELTSVTMSIWMKANSLSTQKLISMKSPGGAVRYVLTTSGTSGGVQAGFVTSGGSVYPTANGVYSTGEWNHVVATYDENTGYGHIYVNGELQNTRTGSGALLTTTNNLYFGCDYDQDQIFDGVLDEIRIYNRALSAGEVQQLYHYAPGPIAHWTFDENAGTTAYDSSANENTGTLTDGPTWTRGKFGSAIQFDGDDDYVSCGTDTSILDPGPAATVAMWVKPDTLNTDYAYFAATTNTQGPFTLYVGASGASQEDNIRYNGGGITCQESNGNDIPINQWSHIAATYDSGDAFLYLDGVQVESCTGGASTLTAGSSAFKIGGYDYLGRFFDGAIDDVKIYNYARTPAQIVEDMGANSPISTGGKLSEPYIHYKFDEQHGTIIYDSGLAGINSSLGTGSSAPTWTKSGRIGGALEFDGGDIGYSDSTIPNSGSFTVSTWIEPDNFAGDHVIFSTTNLNINFQINSDQTIRIQSNGTSVSPLTCESTTAPMQADTWQHIVGMFDQDQNQYKIYYNGKKIQECDTTGTRSGTDVNFYIGRQGDTTLRLLDGSLDELKFYTYALSDTQVLADYNQSRAMVLGAGSTDSDGSTPSNSASREYCIPGDTSTCNPPVLEWKFDEGSGATAYDTTGNSHDGTITNGSWSKGKYSGGYRFNNESVSVVATDADDLSSTSFTMDYWFRWNEYAASWPQLGKMASSGSDTSNEIKWQFKQDDGRWYIRFNDSSTLYAQNSGQYLDTTVDKWHHISIRYDETDNDLIIIQNGTRELLNVNNDFTITPTAHDFRLTSGLKDITVDQVRYFDYARTRAQTAWDYNRGEPIAWYRFDEGESSTAYDASDNSNNGSLGIGTSAPTWTTGKNNGALSFDGSNDYVLLPSDLFNSGDPFSVSLWVNLNSDTHRLVCLRDNLEFILQVDVNEKIRVYTDEWNDVSSDGAITPGQWHHITVSYDLTNMVTYLDGVQINSYADTVTSDSYNTNTIGIGAWNMTQDPTNGKIDDVRIYNYGLTSVQVRDIYNGSAINFQ